MTIKHAASKSVFSLGLGTLLGCALVADPSPAQSNPGDDEPKVTTSPDQGPPIAGEIDYENAKPMPLPSIPGPPNRERGIPTADPTQAPADNFPGETGDGEENPKMLLPPKRNGCAD
jgi:hypothetical protein